MNLLDILKPEFIRAPLTASDKQGVIHELVDLLAEQGAVSTPDELKAAVWSREQTRTTGIGHGLAIPHGKCAGLSGLAMAIGKPAAPLDFDALDGQPVKLVVLLASPPDRTSDHIQALARISKLMAAEDLRSAIYAATSPEAIYDLLRSREG
jgi:fructose-specific phosphotransferase system IIA component